MSNRWDCPLFKVTLEVAEDSPPDAVNSDVVPVQSTVETAVVKPVKSSWKPKKAAAVDGASDSSTVLTTPAEVLSTTSATNAVFFSGTAARRSADLLKDFSAPADALPAVYAYLVEAVAPAPNSSTIASHHGEADLLYELDRTSQNILAAIVAHQADSVEGTPMKFVEYNRELTLHRHTGLSELQRYRRQFVKINGQHPPGTSTAVGSSFIDFLALQL